MTPQLSSRPTLADVRQRSHKKQHRVIGNWFARNVARPSAIYGTWVAIRLNLSANQVTLGALAAALGAAACMGSGTSQGFTGAVFLWHLAYWLDHVDGQVARWRGSANLDGVYLDYLLHHAWSLSQGFALGFGLTSLSGEPYWSIAGFTIGLGWALLALHNDCRYKAVFQRLKSTHRVFRVDGGSGGRPTRSASVPVRGLGMFTWLAAKACEIHVVLLTLTSLAVIGVLAPDAWIRLWKAYVVVMALGAPTLALGRIARSVNRRNVENEFERWFQPLSENSMIDFERPAD